MLHVRSLPYRFVLVTALAIGLLQLAPGTIASADEPPESTQEGTALNPLDVPQESDTAVGRHTSDGNKYVTLHNRRGADAHFLIIRMKDIADDLQPRGAVRLNVKDVQMRNPDTDMWETDDGATFPGGDTAIKGRLSDRGEGEGELVVEFENGWPHCQERKIQFTLEERDNRSANWGNGDNVQELNFYTAADELESEDDPAEFADDGEPKSGTFEKHNIHAGPTVVDQAQTPTTVQAPDLVYGEAHNSPILTGMLEFVALADAEFQPAQADPEVFVFDAQGDEIQDASRVELGNPSITDGRVQVEVLHRSPDEEPGIAIVVHNAMVTVPELRDGQRIGYTAAGSATRAYRMSPAPLITTDETPDMSVRLGSAIAEIGDEYGGYIHIDHAPSVARGDEHQQIEGYMPGIVLEESEAGAIQDGTIEYKPLDDFQIVSDAETRVYLLDAETGEDASGAFGSVTLSTRSDGGLSIELENRLLEGKRLNVVLANVKLDLGTGPFGNQGFRVGIGGTALPGVVNRNVTLAVGATKGEGQSPSGPRQDPLSIVGWTSVAEFTD